MPVLCNKPQFSISVSACLLCAMIILLLPLQWFFAAVIAALFHEACHALAVRLCGGHVLGVQIGQQGTRMHTAILAPIQELSCVLAGPLGSFLLLLFIRFIPRIAFCAAVHGTYNLLPLSHLDGGKALHSVLRMVLPKNARRISMTVQYLTLSVLWLLALYLTICRKVGVMPLLFMLALSIAAKKDLANIV